MQITKIGLMAFMLLLPAFASAATIDVLNRVETKIDKAVTRVKGLDNKAQVLLNRIPDRPEVRQVAADIAVEKISIMIDLYQAGVQPNEILRVLQLQKAGFESWQEGGGPQNMQDKLNGVVNNLETLVDTIQRLRCYQNPNANIVPIGGNAMGELIDVLPDVLLYGMRSILRSLFPDWDSAMEDMINTLPTELVEGVCSGVDTGYEVAEVSRCNVLTTLPWQLKNRLRLVNLQAKRQAELLKAVAKMEPENMVVGATAMVAAGAGATVDAPNPAKALLNQWSETMSIFAGWTEFVLEKQAECLDQEIKIESDFLTCSLSSEYINGTPLAAQAFFARKWQDDGAFGMNFRELCSNYQVNVCNLYREEYPNGKCFFKGWSGPDT